LGLRWLPVVSLAVLLGLVSDASPGPAPFRWTASLSAQENPETAADASRVMALETLWNQAEVSRDAPALTQLIPDTFFSIDSGGSIRTQEEFLEYLKSSPDHPTEIKNESLVAHTYGNTVVVTGVYHKKGTNAGKHFAERGRFTHTWIQLKGAWLCVARQSTLADK
jgi:ketosteroid isomerase-like protein